MYEIYCKSISVFKIKPALMKQWYESLFENYGQKYDNEIFTQGTLGECDFIENELTFDKSLKILDVTSNVESTTQSRQLVRTNKQLKKHMQLLYK